MDAYDKFFDFVMFILSKVGDATDRAFDRALDQILWSNHGNSTA